MGVSNNSSFDNLTPSPFSKKEGYKEFFEVLS
jgi:hypothetical protein